MCDKNDEKCDMSKISEYDVKINQLKLKDMYNGTYLVCIVYAIFAAAILLGSYLNDTIRNIFFNKFIIFTIIFILGSVIIIAILFYYVTNYEPKKTKHLNLYDTYSCPDYWNLVTLDDNSVYNNFDSNVSPNYFKYKCVINKDIFDISDNYKNVNPNYKLNNYNLTNNLLNTTNLDSTNGDYYNSVNKSRIENNINNNNIGHLYKNINDTNIYPTTDVNNNYFAYFQPGAKFKTSNLNNIKDVIINSSLIMNNYSYNPESNIYSNIKINPYNQNNDPYILWNYSNLQSTDVINQYNSATTYRLDNTNFYENFYVYKWNYDNITFNTYNDIFKLSTDTTVSYGVYAGNDGMTVRTTDPNFTLKIGDLIKDKNNIYFRSKENINNSQSKIIFNKIIRDRNNNSIINSYIDTKNEYDGINRFPTGAQLSSMQKGPLIMVDNGFGRPPVISKESLKNNVLNIPVVCDAVYPAYLASVEDINTYGADNTIRCSYAKLCGYSWSDMGCN